VGEEGMMDLSRIQSPTKDIVCSSWPGFASCQIIYETYYMEDGSIEKWDLASNRSKAFIGNFLKPVKQVISECSLTPS
jgi:hypothetical protein